MKKCFFLLFGSLFLLFGCQKSFQFELDAPEALHNRAVGASAAEFLRSDKYNSLLVEVQYMKGAAPDTEAVENMRSFISTYCNKPSGVTITTKEINPPAQANYSVEEILDVEQEYRVEFSGNRRIVIYMLYVNGKFTNENVLGAAYQNTSAVIFSKTIQENSGAIGQPSRTKLETTVLQHEVGHLLGLVDVGTPMQTAHKDSQHGSHCDNTNCLMYYASETTDVLGFLVTSAVPVLDANCVADLKAQGSK